MSFAASVFSIFTGSMTPSKSEGVADTVHQLETVHDSDSDISVSTGFHLIELHWGKVTASAIFAIFFLCIMVSLCCCPRLLCRPCRAFRRSHRSNQTPTPVVVEMGGEEMEMKTMSPDQAETSSLHQKLTYIHK